MTSTIHADKIMNSSGDQDSGLDLLVNDQVKIKTANTDRITVTDTTTTVANDLTVGGTDLFVDTSAEKLGIGTATANQLHQKLNIYSSSEAGIQFMNDATGVANSTDGARISVYEDDIQYTNYESAGKQIFNVGTNGGTTAMTIDSSGRILKPATPRFSARMNGSGNSGTSETWTTMVFDNALVNNGSCYNTSNGQFTAPVAGDYWFSTHVLQMSSSPSYGVLKWLKNGSTNYTGNKCYSTTYDSWMSLSIILTLAANDTLVVQSYNRFNKADYGSFQGFLIG